MVKIIFSIKIFVVIIYIYIARSPRIITFKLLGWIQNMMKDLFYFNFLTLIITHACEFSRSNQQFSKFSVTHTCKWLGVPLQNSRREVCIQHLSYDYNI